MQQTVTRALLAAIALAGLALAPQAHASRLTPSSRLSMAAATSGAHTASVDLPAGTTTVEVAFFFGTGSSSQAPTSVSVDGQTATKRISNETGSTMQIALYTATGVTSGMGKTLAWTNPVTYTSFDIGLEYRDGTVSYGATDFDFCSGCGTLTTNNIANTSGDEILCAYGANGGTLSSYGGGQTDLDGTSGNSYYGFQSKTGAGGTTQLSFVFSAGLDGYVCLDQTTTAVTGRKHPFSGPFDKPFGGPFR